MTDQHYFKPIILVALVLIMSASSFAETKLPKVIADKIQHLEDKCKVNSKSEAIKTKLIAIKKIDISNDNLLDYILDDSLVHCEAGASYRHGNGGKGLTIYTELSNGDVKKTFEMTVYKFSITNENILKILVGGRHCGQKIFSHSKDKIIPCEKTLRWDSNNNKYQLSNY